MVAVPAVFGYIGFVTDVSTSSAVGVGVLETCDLEWWGAWVAEGGHGGWDRRGWRRWVVGFGRIGLTRRVLLGEIRYEGEEEGGFDLGMVDVGDGRIGVRGSGI